MADGAADLCVCILFYGADNYCDDLGRRVLNTSKRQLAEGNVEFRFGLNAVGSRRSAYLCAMAEDYFNDALVVESAENIYKYPLMRRMFQAAPLQAPLTMWFDDNSYLDPEMDVGVWIERVEKHMQYCDMIGSVYTQGLVGNQAEWIRAQPWYTGKNPGPYVKYAAGGWWAAQTDLLTRFDWPAQDIKHHGGDVMLGELIHQQDLQLCHFRDHVMIQTNDSGVEAATVRRGIPGNPVGFDYEHAT
jgi:hypothetical protein